MKFIWYIIVPNVPNFLYKSRCKTNNMSVHVSALIEMRSSIFTGEQIPKLIYPY